MRYFALMVLLVSRFALADSFVVEKTTGPGISESDLSTITELVRSAVIEAGHTVSDKRHEFTLRPKLLKLGDSYVLMMEKLKDGEPVFSSQLKAQEMNEMDKVAGRLTRAVIQSDREALVGEITEVESRDGTQRRPARKGFFLGFGPSSLFNLGSTGLAFNLFGGWAWDVNRVTVKLLGDVTGKDEVSTGSFGLGANYHFSMKDITPFVSADLGYGYANDSAGNSENGFTLGLGGGYQFFRTSSINVEMGLRYSVFMGSSALGAPMALAGRLALYF